MFTGIVECTVPVGEMQLQPGGGRLTLSSVPFAPELTLGESVAVNGCCLTVVSTSDTGTVVFDLLQETLRLTNLGGLRTGDPVNVERAMRADTRLSGHFVQGHVDTTAEVLHYGPDGQDHRLVIALPESGRRLVIPKGSITIDGMSLTIARLERDQFTIWITPHTHAVTVLAGIQAGRRVNVEFDMMAKYLDRYLTLREEAAQPG